MPNSAIRVTVFASSTPQTSPAFTAASAEFGKILAEAGGVAVFGGGNAGCMGAFFEATIKAGGRVHGITHRMFIKPGGSSLSEENAADLESLEIVEGSDLTMRKRRLLDAADCLVTLPGGVGTFDELFMAIGERAVGCGSLPVLILNTNGYYDGVIQQLTRAYDEGTLRKHWSEYVEVVTTPQAACEWCLRQGRRPTPPAPTVATASYRTGLVHGAAASALALVALMAAASLRRGA
jgi:uncharacterized protein (TIGR00730 family)